MIGRCQTGLLVRGLAKSEIRARQEGESLIRGVEKKCDQLFPAARNARKGESLEESARTCCTKDLPFYAHANARRIIAHILSRVPRPFRSWRDDIMKRSLGVGLARG